MRRLGVFDQVSADGYFALRDGDVSWAHPKERDPELEEFSASSAGGGGTLLFGRVTYEMMQSFWTTPAAAELNPAVARRMNEGPKLVASRTIKTASWKNTTILRGDLVSEIKRLKSEDGESIVILGSGSLVAQLAGAGLIDEIQLMVIPVVLGEGKGLFDGVGRRFDLRLVRSRTFPSGRALLVYEPRA